MKRLFLFILLFFTFACAPTSHKRSDHWSYHENGGPNKWASLSADYALCGSGQRQSPVDLVPGLSGIDERWELHYKITGLKIAHNEHVEELVNNGHTIQVSPEEGSFISLNGKKFELKQFHFHTPSEHTLEGVHAPMEVHFVHQSADKKFAVIAAFVNEGRTNQNMARLIQVLPNSVGEKKTDLNMRYNPQMFLSKNLLAHHYSGSLTTPPCVEGVEWLVLKKPITMSKDQIAEFAKRLHRNNRPPMPLNGRMETEDEIIIRR